MKVDYRNFGYEANDLLVNPPTGTIDTAEQWAIESEELTDGNGKFLTAEEAQKKYSTLCKVK